MIPSLADKTVGRTNLVDSTVDSIQNCPDGSVGVEYEYDDPDSPVDLGDLVGPGGPDGPVGPGGPDGPFSRGSAYLGPID